MGCQASGTLGSCGWILVGRSMSLSKDCAQTICILDRNYLYRALDRSFR